jgi:O-antigen ligase
MVLSLLLGGGTRGGFMSDSILELCAIAAFLLSLSSFFTTSDSESKKSSSGALLLCLAVTILPLIQLIPLPPSIWIQLPQRDQVVAVFNLLGRGLPWLPLTVSPTSTWVSVLSLLAPLAIFLSVIQLSYRERRSMSLFVMGVGSIAAVVGIVQVVQGQSSPLRFFAFTSDKEAVGFFANRNHFAAFMYTLFLFTAAWTTDLALTVGSWRKPKSPETSSIASLTACVLGLVVLIAVDAITRSRAGLALMIIAVAGAFMLAFVDQRRPSGRTPIKLIVAALTLVFILVVQFGLYRIVERFAVDPLEDARVPFAHNTIAAAKAYMPFGSGVGTFVSVYPTFERPEDAISNVYANHAHNDLLEIWLEGGVISIVLGVAFVTWLVLRSKQIWWHVAPGMRPIDVLLARAATIAIPLLIVHSVVDYPLRTGAMMAVFAFACALLIEPRSPAQEEGKLKRLGGRQRTSEIVRRVLAPEQSTADSLHASDQPSPRPQGRWGENIEWPKEWQKDEHK